MKILLSFLTSGKQYHPVHFVAYVILQHAQLLPILLMTFKSVRVMEIPKVNRTLSPIIQFILHVCSNSSVLFEPFSLLHFSDVSSYTQYDRTAFFDLSCSDKSSLAFSMNMCASCFFCYILYFFPLSLRFNVTITWNTPKACEKTIELTSSSSSGLGVSSFMLIIVVIIVILAVAGGLSYYLYRRKYAKQKPDSSNKEGLLDHMEEDSVVEEKEEEKGEEEKEDKKEEGLNEEVSGESDTTQLTSSSL